MVWYHASFRSFVRSFVRSLIHSFIHSFIRSFVRSFIRSFANSFIHSFIHSFIRSFFRSFAHSFECDCRLHKRMPSKSTQSTKSLPGRSTVSYSRYHAHHNEVQTPRDKETRSAAINKRGLFKKKQVNAFYPQLGARYPFTVGWAERG